jgi:hypothetical protein
MAHLRLWFDDQLHWLIIGAMIAALLVGSCVLMLSLVGGAMK